jgi:hypothetical protein
MVLDFIKAVDAGLLQFMLRLGSCNYVDTILWIVCRMGVLDPKTPAKRDNGCPGQADSWLWQKRFRIDFLRNTEKN